MYFDSNDVLEIKNNLINKRLSSSYHKVIYSDHVFRENTIRAFKKAIILGADGIEFDVCISLDGKLIINHEQVLLPCKDQNEDNIAAVMEFMSQDFSRLELHTVGSIVPTLYDILKLVEEANNIRKVHNFLPLSLHIEFKQPKSSRSEDRQRIFDVAQKTVKAILNYQKLTINTSIRFQDIYFCSFNQAVLMHLIDLFSGIVSDIPETNFKFAFSVGSKPEANCISQNKLKSIFTEEQSFVAYDFMLGDISKSLINIVLNRKKDIFVSVTNWHDYEENQETIIYLLTLIKEVTTYFKCDNISEFDRVLLELREKQQLLGDYENDYQLQQEEQLRPQELLSNKPPRPKFH